MPIGTAAAIIGGSVISGGLGLLGANSAARAQERAAEQQFALGQDNLALQRQIFNRNQANIAPYLRVGETASTALTDLSDPAKYENVLARFRESPDYNFAFGEGIRALENSAAARGGLLGGNFTRGATQFGQGFATNYLQNYINRLMGMTQLGANAATGNATAANVSGANMGNAFNSMSNAAFNTGAANASGIVGGTNALTGAISGGVNNYLLLNALNRSSYQQPILTGAYPSPYSSSWMPPSTPPGAVPY